MKLSEKGLGKLYNSKACYYDDETEEEVVALSYFEHVFEFEPDDFQDMVILTIEEVKQVKMFLDDAVELHDKGVVVIQSSGFETIQLINERIEQVEKSK